MNTQSINLINNNNFQSALQLLLLFLRLMSYLQNINTLFQPKAQSPSASRSKSYKTNKSILSKHIPSNQSIEYKHMIPSSKYQHKNEVSQEYQIGQDLVKVLREQNLNLKQQNQFLIKKLRLLSQKEEESVELATKHSEILEDLKMQNEELKNQLRYMNELASSKVEQFGKKLAKITRMSEEEIPESDVQLRDLNHETGVLGLKSAQSVSQKFDSNTNLRPIILEKPELEQRMTDDAGKSLEDLNNQFEAVLYSCKVEKDNEKRKSYRKRLIELTNKMKTMNRK